uniref:Endo/exonuclease/phosphatase domain-containing protein n=1 Tax=Angiostrongylus cantonensis TaxID=6313 RepID=A0A0K0CTD2_ANGCA
MDLERFYREDHTFFKVIIGDFKAKIGPRRSSEERHIGTYGLEWNEQEASPSRGWTWESPNGEYHNEIDHIIVNRKFCPTDVAVVPKFYTGSDHRLLRARFYFSRKGEKAAKFKNRSPRTTRNWDLFNSLVGCWEDAVVDNIDEEYDRLIQHLHVSAMKGESSKVTKRRLSPETLELIRQRGLARAAGNRELTSELAKQCKQAIKDAQTKQ